MLFFNNLTNHFINFELLTNLKSKHLGSCFIKTITEQKNHLLTIKIEHQNYLCAQKKEEAIIKKLVYCFLNKF